MGIGIDPYSGPGFSGTGGFGGVAGSDNGMHGPISAGSKTFLDNGDGFGPASSRQRQQLVLVRSITLEHAI